MIVRNRWMRKREGQVEKSGFVCCACNHSHSSFDVFLWGESEQKGGQNTRRESYGMNEVYCEMDGIRIWMIIDFQANSTLPCHNI